MRSLSLRVLALTAVVGIAAAGIAAPAPRDPGAAAAGTSHPLQAGHPIGAGAGGRTAGSGAPGFGVGRTGGRPAPPVVVGRTDPSTPIDFSFVLRLPDPAAVDAYLAGLYDPRSPGYRQFLTASEYGARFGMPLERIEAMEAWATGQGLTVVERYPQRTAVRLRAPAATVNLVFDVTLLDEHDPATGVTYPTVATAPLVPAAIASVVEAVAGLDDRPALSFAVEPSGFTPASVPRTGLGPRDLATAYDIAPLYEAGITGADQYLAIVSFDTYRASDIETFERELGIVDAPPIERIAVGEPLTEPGDGSGEVTLDIDVVRSVAPQARILNFEAPNNGSVGFAEMVDAIVEDGRARIISVSWGLCDTEDRLSPIGRLRGERSFQAMAAAGVSLFAASGDWGAYSCTVRDPSDHRISVFWPASSPFVVSVGGTFLSVREDGSYLDEAGWEDYLSTGGTGGGLNPVAARPDWQRGAGVANEHSNGARQLPDIAAAADPDSGYAVYYTVDDGGWQMVGGTSGAAPFWAAISALFGEVNTRAGVGQTGFLAPVLYEIAAATEPDTVLHDVVRGGDLFHRAGPGWDYATGLGSPDVTALAGAIVDHLRGDAAP